MSEKLIWTRYTGPKYKIGRTHCHGHKKYDFSPYTNWIQQIPVRLFNDLIKNFTLEYEVCEAPKEIKPEKLELKPEPVVIAPAPKKKRPPQKKRKR